MSARRRLHAFTRGLLARAYRLHLDRGGDWRESVLLASSGRSGSTWVAEAINHANTYRVLFEPFRPGHVPALRQLRERQYLRPDTEDPRIHEEVRRVLSGEIRGAWVDQHNRRLFPGKRLIKEIRGNLFLGWMRAAFPGMPLVYLLRHPCGVARSRLQLGWPAPIEQLLEQEELVSDHFPDTGSEASAARDPFERQIFFWCLENRVPLAQLARGDALVLFYEHLFVRPEEEFARLFAHLGEETPANLERIRGRPSALARDGSAVVTGSDPIRDWQAHTSEDQLGRAVEILTLFDLDRIYGPDAQPRVEPDEALDVLDVSPR